MDIVLTVNQRVAVNRIIEAQKMGVKLSILRGSAGTGKTTIMKEIANELIKLEYKPQEIVFAAPTHKAAAVLTQKLNYQDRYPEVKTLASLLHMKYVVDEVEGKEVYTFTSTTDTKGLLDYKLAIIDEASMIDSQQYNKLLELAFKHNCNLLFVGDIKQLPPINEDISKSLGTTHIYPFPLQGQTEEILFEEITLTEILRQGKDNPIIELSYDLDRVSDFSDNVLEGKGYLYTTDREKVLKRVSEGAGGDSIKYLAWKNDEVNKFTKDVRKIRYGDKPKEFYEGEFITFSHPYNGYKNNDTVEIERLKENIFKLKTFLIPTQDFLTEKQGKALGLGEEGESPFTIFEGRPYEGYLSVDLDCFMINSDICVLKEKSKKIYNVLLKVLKELAKDKKISWKDFFTFQNYFAKVGHTYSMTVHKSQGSTFEKVVINLKDLEQNKKEYEKILYTAITRASDMVIFYYPLD